MSPASSEPAKLSEGTVPASTNEELAAIANGFNRLAHEYVDIIAGPSTDLTAWLGKVEVAVAELYAAAVSLPLTEPFDDDAPEMSMPDRRRLMAELVERVGDGGIFYSFVFHPLQPNAEVVGSSLAEDLASIYEDLYGGITLLSAGGSYGNAIWEWQLSFRIHWGRHALGALQALNALLR